MPPQTKPVSPVPEASGTSDFLRKCIEAELNPKYWYMHGKAYDFTPFIEKHPGGADAILLGQGRECTGLFETYHTFRPSEDLIKQYQVKGDFSHVQPVYTFEEDGFYRTIKRRARDYFVKNGIKHTKANWFGQLSCWANLLALAFLSWAGFVRGNLICAFLYGIARALLIVRPTHASSHFSYSTNPLVNKFMHWATMILSGSSPVQWTAKHVLSHHIDTNVVPADEDSMYPIKRVIPILPRRAWHKYQHIYMWLVYPITTFLWTWSDILKLTPALFGSKIYESVVELRMTPYDWAETVSVFAFHVLFRYVLIFANHSFWWSVLIFIVSEAACGYWFALQFAVNHEVECAAISSGDHAAVSNPTRDFGKHQLLTSHNYDVNSHLALHLSGGLNLQIEHHLFPSVHYHHYFALRHIVRATAKEFNVPYFESKNFYHALIAHYDCMKKLGSQDNF